MNGDLYRVPVLGGTPTLSTRDVASAPSFTATASRFCFVRFKPNENLQSVVSANLDGAEEKIIYSGTGTDDYFPAWSPDGKQLVVSLPAMGPNGDRTEFSFVNLSTGEITTRFPLDGDVAAAALTPDGKGIAFVRPETGAWNLWIQPVAGGPAERLSNFHLSRGIAQHIDSVHWSSDGKRIGLLRVSYTGDVIVLQDQSQ
jgi:Tol biopolymer transport system component